MIGKLSVGALGPLELTFRLSGKEWEILAAGSLTLVAPDAAPAGARA